MKKKFVCAAVTVMLALLMSGCPDPTGETEQGQNDAVVTDLELNDFVTAPVKWETPDTGNVDDQYTGTIDWQYDNGAAFDDNTFEPDTVYIAIVTLTAKEGYTFTGVGNFSCTGADDVKQDNNTGTSIKVTITFPATAPDDRTPTRTPVFANDSKALITSNSAVFTLTGAAYSDNAIWKVYPQLTGGTVADGIIRNYDSAANTFTLSSASLSGGTYYVTVTEDGANVRESIRVLIYAQERSATPQISPVIKAKASHESVNDYVSFTVTNHAGYSGPQYHLYNSSNGVTLGHSGSTLYLEHASDVPAGSYFIYVTETEEWKAESENFELTVQDRSAPVEVVKSSVKKSSGEAESVEFVLVAPVPGSDYFVYDDNENDSEESEAVTVSAESGKLILSSKSGTALETGKIYFVSVREPGNGESERVQLSIIDADQSGTPNPVPGVSYKASASAADVTFTLNNDEYDTGSVTFKAYASNAPGDTTPLPVTFVYDDVFQKLTITSNSGALVARAYYITADEDGDAIDFKESPRALFQVRDPYNISVEIGIGALPGEHSIGLEDDDLSVAKDSTLTVRVANPENYSDFKWRINGDVMEQGNGDSEFTIQPLVQGLSKGLHRLTIVVVLDGMPYSREITFTVE